ncbi:MAG: M23 family metallopeptidase [Bacillota bacterium]
MREKDDWGVFNAPDQEREESPPLLIAVFLRMHRFLAVKLTAALIVVFLAVMLCRGDYPWGKPVLGALQYVATRDLDLEALLNQAVPAFRSVWNNLEVPEIIPAEDGAAPLLPLDGELVSGYGLRTDPVSGLEMMHYGIDLAAPRGTVVQAVLAGLVTESSPGEDGHTVILDHDGGWQTLYRELAAVVLQEGEAVAAGQALGSLGEPRLWEQPHLHFELRYNGRPVPLPAAWLSVFQTKGAPL